MDSDSVSQNSTSEEDPAILSEVADGLLPIMDGLITDMKVVETKVNIIQEEMFKRSVQPLPGLMRTLWTAFNLPPSMEFDALLQRIFQSAERLDKNTRIIHFSDETAPLFGKSYMPLFELVDILIDGLQFTTGKCEDK